ncbi:MAG: hypothetical protein PHE56_11070 [Bacteroidales bacterium]|nr:hypothetical protein [Bacteroidales bacterium]
MNHSENSQTQYDAFLKELSNKSDEMIINVINNREEYNIEAYKAALFIANERNLEIPDKSKVSEAIVEDEEYVDVELNTDAPYLFNRYESEEERKRREEREEKESIITNEDIAQGLNYFYSSWIVLGISFIICLLLGINYETRTLGFIILIAGVIISSFFKIDFFKNREYSGREFSSFEKWLAKPFIPRNRYGLSFSNYFRRGFLWFVAILPIVILMLIRDNNGLRDSNYSNLDQNNPYLTQQPLILDEDTLNSEYDSIPNYSKSQLIYIADSLYSNEEYSLSIKFYEAALSKDTTDSTIQLKIYAANALLTQRNINYLLKGH